MKFAKDDFASIVPTIKAPAWGMCYKTFSLTFDR